MKVSREGRRRMITNVMMGLSTGTSIINRLAHNKSETYEYHSQAEYSVLIRRDTVGSPACEVFEEVIKDDNSA
jgi:hypothetical protein